MCYNYETDDKQSCMKFPDLTGTIYDSTKWDNNPFYSGFTFRKAPVIINEDKKTIQHYKGERILKWTKSIEDSNSNKALVVMAKILNDNIKNDLFSIMGLDDNGISKLGTLSKNPALEKIIDLGLKAYDEKRR
jgi:hypothetical protein